MNAKSIFALILFSILTFGLASIATSAGTRITNNGFEDSFPKTAGGYVVWQGKPDTDNWEIYLYDPNDEIDPVKRITNNTYNDISPEISVSPNTGKYYVTWQAAAAPLGEIFLYDIETKETTRLTKIWDDLETNTINTRHDHDPKIANGKVVWVTHTEGGVDSLFGPGDIWLYDIATKAYQNISELVEPINIHDDFSFRFDGNRILWGHEHEVRGPVDYVYELATGSMYLNIDPEDDREIPYLSELARSTDPTSPYEYLLETGVTIPKPEGLAMQDDPSSDGDFSVSALLIGGSDREIHLDDRQFKRGGRITANRIEDTQPAIKDNIVVWKGGEGDNSEIYLYEIQPLFADAGYDFKIDFASLDSKVITGKAGGGANQYRWFLLLGPTDGKTELTKGWQPVVDGQAPLSLAGKSGFILGPQTLALEITDGATYVSDKVTMDLIGPPLALVSPADGSEFNIKEFPVFAWKSTKDYIQFKIQFSTQADFEGTPPTLSLPGGDRNWLNETSISLNQTQLTELRELLQNSGPTTLYWRILARDGVGKEEVSVAQNIFVSKY